MRKLALRVLSLAVLIAVLQLPIGMLLDAAPFPERDVLDEGLRGKTDIVYFGDSVLASSYGGDVDRRSIAAMLKDQLGGPSVTLVQYPGYELEIYRDFLEYTARQPQRPRAVVVPINLRSLGPGWPFTFPVDRARLTWGDVIGLGYHRPRATFRWTTLPRQPATPSFPDIAERWRYHYLYPLSEEHPRLRALKELIGICRKAGIVPILYVTPINVGKGVRLVGPEFAGHVARETALCRAAGASLQEDILDLSTLVPEEKDFENVEHLLERGRMQVAVELARAVRKKLSP
ncbi:MAG TPA: hypothetical protein VNM14_02560 [Planctomycetota bacterium]|jgi:hypothetical protein|nr:hypothetical protein [Planctomycetota bacterium]